jgi:hypothetical protein
MSDEPNAPAFLPPLEGESGVHWIGGRVGSNGTDATGNINVFCSCRESNPDSSVL